MKPIFILCITVLTAALFTRCNNNENKAGEELADPLITHRDTAAGAGKDFFQYANGTWFTENPIPDTERANGIFRTIADTINRQIQFICEEASMSDTPKGSNKQKIGDFYASGMDTAAIEEAGITPLREEFIKISQVTDTKSLMMAIARLHSVGAGPAFSFYVGQDDKISTKYAVFLGQGGLSLGDRNYYFNTDARTVNIRNEFQQHLKTMFTLLGETEAHATEYAATVMQIETDMASASRKLEALRDPEKNYNKMSVAQLNKITPGIRWNEVLPALGISNADSVIVGQPEFFSAFAGLTRKYSIEEWKTYLKWNLVSSYASYLDTSFDQENFHFFATVMGGVKKQKSRWKRVVQQTDADLGELIGQVYVDEYLPKGSKEKLLEIGNNIRDVYAERIKKLDWMSDATKEKALRKLNKIVMKVGYPDEWKDLSSLEVERGAWCKNVMSANKWRHQYMTGKFGKPVNRNEWGMYPQTYNAYYNPSNNEIAVPGSNIIVPGFEGRMPDDAILYGIIGGSTFGHEITHGFDDQGSQYDENGNLRNWWTAEDRKKFIAKTKRLVQQYSKYTVLDSIHVNGDATQGENIADLGGVVMGYEAFKRTPQYKENKTINGLTPDERFFLAYGYAWMINIKGESLAQMIMTDVHAPPQFRVNGPLSNIPEFYKTFNIKEGDPMYLPDSLRVVIW